MRKHRAFRPPGCARCIADGCNVILIAGSDGRAYRVRACRFAGALQVGVAAQQRLAIVPQSARIDVDDACDAQQVTFDREKFVDLLLIFGEQHLRFAVIKNVKKLLRGQIGIGKDHAGAERQSRVFGPEALDNVLAQDRKNVPALQAECRKSARGSFDTPDHIAPRVAHPNAVPLLAHAGALGVGLGAIEQELRQGFAAGGSRIVDTGGRDDHCLACPR